MDGTVVNAILNNEKERESLTNSPPAHETGAYSDAKTQSANASTDMEHLPTCKEDLQCCGDTAVYGINK
eukprot:7358099-Karenia_brevis.AAC.1